MQFNYIQTFKIDSTKVNGAPFVYITSVGLYFKEKPRASTNSSGITEPGVSVHICPVENDVPKPDTIVFDETSVAEYGQVSALSDASTPTSFKFGSPVPVKTDELYGIVVRFEDDDYKLWNAVQNEFLLGSTSKYSGTSNDGDGRLYESSNDPTGVRALSDRDLKFFVNIAKFTANTATIDIVPDNYEFFTVSSMSSATKFRGGETIYQPFGNTSSNTLYTYAGRCATTLGNTFITGTSTSFTTDYSQDDYILLVDTSNTNNQQVAKIFSISDTTSLILSEGASFTAASCYHVRLPAASLVKADYVNNQIICQGSTASNSSFRYVTNSVFYFTNSTGGGVFGGTNYSNSDFVRVSNGSINCIANVTTSATGAIVNLSIRTPGADFPNVSHSVITIANSSNLPSTGTGASVSYVMGAPLRGEISKATATLSSIDNFNAHVIDPDIVLNNTSFTTGVSNIAYCNTSYANQAFESVPFNEPYEFTNYVAMIASRSNEVRNTTNLFYNDKSGVIRIRFGVNVTDVVSKPLFYAPFVAEESLNVLAFTNQISSTTSNTASEVGPGNTASKHITKRVKFANNSFAEDIRVYINAYRPANTDIKVYAKIHNSNDPEAFDDKAWSPLEIKDGASLRSAQGNKDDLKEYTYGLPAWPQVSYTTNGTATSTSSNNVLVTTNDLTSELATNDLVRVYNPLFSSTNYMVSSVASVNSTAVTLTSLVTNTSLVSSGLRIDKLAYPTAAFNNIQNSNVARYYTTSRVEVDTYNSLSIKIVMLADSQNIIPEVDDIRVIGVSA